MFDFVPISRREFFGRLTGPGEWTEQDHQSRIAKLEAEARSAVLPYEFNLDVQQTAQLFDAIGARVRAMSDEELRTGDLLGLITAIDATMVRPWREAHERAGQIRDIASAQIADFLAGASPDDLQRLRRRFNVLVGSAASSIEEEVRRQAQAWLESLADSRILEHDATTIRELLFSELRSWCG